MTLAFVVLVICMFALLYAMLSNEYCHSKARREWERIEMTVYFQRFLDENHIKTGEDFSHFMAVITEHCLDKGIRDYEVIKKTWRDHKNSLKNTVKSIKKHA